VTAPPDGDAPRRETGERIEVALAIPARGSRVLVARRAGPVHLSGTWEFPGGKVRAGEAPAAAARRELHEETGLVAGPLEPLVVLVHDYDGRALRLHVFLAREPAGELRDDPPREFSWKSQDELGRLEMPEANRPMLRALRWRLGSG
jgi:8-oxo-dGTP diphosphatase